MQTYLLRFVRNYTREPRSPQLGGQSLCPQAHCALSRAHSRGRVLPLLRDVMLLSRSCEGLLSCSLAGHSAHFGAYMSCEH
jgi:hypothetical protein